MGMWSAFAEIPVFEMVAKIEESFKCWVKIDTVLFQFQLFRFLFARKAIDAYTSMQATLI